MDLITATSGPFFSQIYAEKKTDEITRKISMEIFQKALKTDLKHFDDENYYNKYTYTINEYARKCFEQKSILQNSISILISVVLIVNMMGELSPWLIVISIFTVVLSTFLGTKINKVNQTKIQALLPNNREARYVERIFYLKDYAYDLKCTNVATFLLDKYKLLITKNRVIYEKHNARLAGFTLLNAVLFGSMNIFIMSLLSYQIISGEITLGCFVSMITASSYLRVNLTQLMGQYRNLHNLNLYRKQIEEFFSVESSIENSTGVQEISIQPWSIDFNNVSFSYPNSAYHLKNISLHIEKNKKVAIVGRNGAGKTTLLKILLRLYEPVDGEITINGTNYKSFDTKKYRCSIGTAFQNASIYALSFRDNLQIYRKKTDKQLNDTIVDMKIDSILSKNRANLDTQFTKEFDNNGIVLSGGEAQKIALARLYKSDFSLLILDEPSAALDPISEYDYITNMLNTSNTTTIFVTHRLALAKSADYIYVLDQGEIVEEGDHSTLLQLNGLYCEMYNKQYSDSHLQITTNDEN